MDKNRKIKVIALSTLLIVAVGIVVWLMAGGRYKGSFSLQIRPFAGCYIKPQDPLVEINAESITYGERDAAKIAAKIEKTLRQQKKRNDLYDAIYTVLRETEGEVYGLDEEQGCYVSVKPLIPYNFSTKKVSHTVHLILFSEDKSRMWEMLVQLDYDEVTLCDRVDIIIEETYIANPMDPYAYVVVEQVDILSKENQLYDSEIKVLGDCFSALPPECKLTYKEISAPENLVWIDFER